MTTDGASLPQLDRSNMFGMGMGGPSVPLMSLPLLMQFTRNVGGKSGMGRRLSANLFSKVSKTCDEDYNKFIRFYRSY